ncbi:MAG: TonB-dependent receptor, partial [Sediminibacterium sp.]|nr:TonB-dependent receptor [Sediminibacterium sp.]
MKAILIFIAGMMLASLLKAQVLVKGTVKDNKGRILAGANIAIKDSYDGTMSDSTGSFSFKTTEKGNALLVASNIGYRTMELPVVLGTDSVVISFNLKEEINELKAVIITAGSYEASDKKKGTVLKALDIATTAGANADISATIQTLPGAQKVGEQEGLFIRGGSDEEAKIIIDGTVVNNFFYSSVPGISQRGRFSPFLFSGTVFSSGGYSALYGQALSSVLSLESLDIPEKSELQVGLSPLFATVGLQQVANNKKSSFGFSYNWTNLAVYQKLVPQAPDFFKVPDFHTADMNYRFKTKKNGVFKVYAYYNAGALGVRNPSLDSVGLWNAFSLKNQNLFTNLSFRQFLGNGWKINIAASVSYNKDEILTQVQNQQYQAVPL